MHCGTKSAWTKRARRDSGRDPLPTARGVHVSTNAQHRATTIPRRRSSQQANNRSQTSHDLASHLREILSLRQSDSGSRIRSPIHKIPEVRVGCHIFRLPALAGEGVRPRARWRRLVTIQMEFPCEFSSPSVIQGHRWRSYSHDGQVACQVGGC